MIKEITVKHQNTETKFVIDIVALKNEIRAVEKEIVQIKKVLHVPHTTLTASQQSKLVMDYKPWATYLYTLRMAMKNRIHTSVLIPKDPADGKTPLDRQNAVLAYWLSNRMGYQPSFLVKLPSRN